jgi:hypothetical protein
LRNWLASLVGFFFIFNRSLARHVKRQARLLLFDRNPLILITLPRSPSIASRSHRFEIRLSFSLPLVARARCSPLIRRSSSNTAPGDNHQTPKLKIALSSALLPLPVRVPASHRRDGPLSRLLCEQKINPQSSRRWLRRRLHFAPILTLIIPINRSRALSSPHPRPPETPSLPAWSPSVF